MGLLRQGEMLLFSYGNNWTQLNCDRTILNGKYFFCLMVLGDHEAFSFHTYTQTQTHTHTNTHTHKKKLIHTHTHK